MKRADGLLAACAAAGIGAVGIALVSQHVYGMQPCAWCVLQRVVFVAIAAAALLGLAWRAPAGRRTAAALVLALSACGAAAALWQQLVASNSTSCQLTLAERIVGALGLDARWPDVFMAMASCAEAQVRLVGVPYPLWSLLLFLLLGAAAAVLLRRPSR